MKTIIALFFFLTAISVIGVKGQAPEQKAPDSLRKDALKIFLDLKVWCDISYIKKNINYVNYVRDLKESDLYILITSQNTGSGGEEITIFFQGQNRYKIMNDTLTLNTSPETTDDEKRIILTKYLKMGLMRYVAKTPIGQMIKIEFGEQETETEVVDKWKSWVFSLNSNGYANGQDSYKYLSFNNSFSANKITQKFKEEFYFGNYFNKQTYVIDSATTYINLNRSNYLNNSMVFSINDHWSAGGSIGANTSDYSNIKYSYNISPAIEYNLFRYQESNKRQLRFLYNIGLDYNHYIDTTIYNKIEETTPTNSLNIAYSTVQKWGSVNVSLSGSAFLNDFSKNSLSIYSSIDWRIFKGFSLSLSGNYSFVHNQISLPKGEATTEEILLQQRQMATGSTYWFNFGIRYTFGSIYNNVVNPRFGG